MEATGRTTKKIVGHAIVGLLALAFLWRGWMGIRNYSSEVTKMREQFFPESWAPVITAANTYLLLTVGLLLSAGLFRKALLPYSLMLAVITLAGYAVYSELALLSAFGYRPCACIGWFEHMKWWQLLLLNSGLLILTIMAFFMIFTEGGCENRNDNSRRLGMRQGRIRPRRNGTPARNAPNLQYIFIYSKT
ncbi:hypothetical protein JHJ32_06840 [Parapedobacter sp. ISTM3]|uniref:MauE/DoxX family redox-associated membrane protein n=1 Tax=Parapedobacter sp. ISTM3 TaxID=2800130 RepID=UPI0019085559|nr:MauE/DoxX family redox-associated membrane protein [Parapedobacter sp. ISTM3]MBK1439693.1 hypothetical protein [Parapedobacter sp. ISTM3]